MNPRKVTVLEIALVGGMIAVAGVGVSLLRSGSPASAPEVAQAPAGAPAGVQGADWDGAGRDRAPAESPPAAVESPAPARVPAPVPVGPVAEAQPAEPVEAVDESAAITALHPQVRAAMTSVLEANRTRLRNACFKGQPVRLRVEASFDPDGRLLVLNIPDDPRNAAASACVREQRVALAVDPPGRHVTVEVPFELP